MGWFRKPVGMQVPRGFESPPLRHPSLHRAQACAQPGRSAMTRSWYRRPDAAGAQCRDHCRTCRGVHPMRALRPLSLAAIVVVIAPLAAQRGGGGGGGGGMRGRSPEVEERVGAYFVTVQPEPGAAAAPAAAGKG